MTPYGRREGWEDNPEGWPEAPQVGAPVGGHGAPICWYWRSDADGNATWGPTSRPVPQWTRPGATPWRPSAGMGRLRDLPSHPRSHDLDRRHLAAQQPPQLTQFTDAH